MKFLHVFFASFLAFSSFGQKISISLFNELNLQTILVTPVSGRYSLITPGGEFILNPNQILYISKNKDSVMVRDMASNLGTWSRVTLVGKTGNDVIRVKPIVPAIPAQVYDDNLGFYVDFGRMMAINLVEVDSYIAGVVEAEAGPSAHPEFYKAQVLLARTYAMGHMERHAGEGFNLCDGVHCQAYKGKSTKNPAIIKATEETKGQVVVNSENQLIVGAFHANCGGQTANSGQVWLKSFSYLVSVNDPFCRSQPSATWEVRISLEEWQRFLSTKGVDTENIPLTGYSLLSKDREYVYTIAGKMIPLTDIRSFFNLRSAFFTVELISGQIRLKGRGYGHGVGMCQDGAMQMARRGRSYKEILQHYFTGIQVVNYSELNTCSDPHDDLPNH